MTTNSDSDELRAFRFSTESLPQEHRIAMWQDLYGRSLTRRILTPLQDGPFNQVEMTVQVLGRVRDRSKTGACITRMSLSGAGTARRTPELLSDGNDDVILYIQETGHRIVSQFGREVTEGPGGGVLTSNAEPSTIIVPEASRFATIGLPRRLMMALAPGLEDAFILPLPSDTGVLRLLLNYLDILEDDDAVGTPELARAVATHIHDLCAVAIGATRDAAEVAKGRGLRAARLRAVKADIAQNLADGDVSPGAVAARQRVTPRYLHKIFECAGTTLSKFVLGQRLARVHRMLGDPRYAHRTIGALAYDAGFGDLSTFNREFRRHFGATPSDVRAAVANRNLKQHRPPAGASAGREDQGTLP